jgi:hypothetical protein
MGLVAPHFQSFGIDGLAAASSDPILVPDFNIAPAAILDIGRLPDFGRNGGARACARGANLRTRGKPSRSASLHACRHRDERRGNIFGRQDLGRQS